MGKRIDKSSRTRRERGAKGHRFEHWRVDNQVYFITARVADQRPAFAAESAKQVFWDRFNHWTAKHGFVPWITSLLDNHYHTLGYLKRGGELPKLMRRLHGSVAKMTNDLLPERIVPFWRDDLGREYFDGCIRDEQQARRTYRYVYLQCRRHGIRDDPAGYPHTVINVDCERAVRRALELDAFMPEVPYPRYER